MKPTTAIGVAALAIAALGAALYFRPSGTTAGAASSEAGGALLGGFAARVNDVARLEIETEGARVAVAREGELWVLPERGSFPADMAKVRAVLLGLGELVAVEQKTANPARFGDLGLEAPTGADASLGLVAQPAESRVGTRVVARSGDGAPLVDLVLGKSATGARFDRPERYARLVAGGPSWLVRGRIDVDAGTTGWMSKDLPKLPRALPTSIEIAHPDGEQLRVAKDEAGTWTLGELPKGRELAWAGVAGSLAGALENWSPEDARARNDVPELDGDDAVRATIRDSRGLVLEVRTVELEGATWFAASARVEAPAPEAPLEVAEGEEGAGETPSTPPVDTAAAEAEAARWNGLFERFAVQLPSWTAAPLRKRTEELLKPLAPAGPAADWPTDLPFGGMELPAVPPAEQGALETDKPL